MQLFRTVKMYGTAVVWQTTFFKSQIDFSEYGGPPVPGLSGTTGKLPSKTEMWVHSRKRPISM